MFGLRIADLHKVSDILARKTLKSVVQVLAEDGTRA
jgi:hypothetical protein